MLCRCPACVASPKPERRTWCLEAFHGHATGTWQERTPQYVATVWEEIKVVETEGAGVEAGRVPRRTYGQQVGSLGGS